ncbi:hypothetical protein OYE22_18285 [Streptomyces sp. 71268]|uniref:hypothetical protein n=1 Tax=Streptomyces sp. 71268 TaxID=3002640 RepID=UPI0023F652D3|nr:hypothetical protein [Streptomyces sp. 71268]WEV26930.1 hypothetical protein OYE22_18285 [Streptomyces sp. 71268]
MPTPYGSRGGMAFSADELRVLRRALALALEPSAATVKAAPITPGPARAAHGADGERVPFAPGQRSAPGPDRDEEVREFLRLAQGVDEAAREGGRLRAFLLAELARYRAALPGAAVSYLEQLASAVAAGYVPCAADLVALRALCATPASPAETRRRTTLLRRCEWLAEMEVRARLVALPGGRATAPRPTAGPVTARPHAPRPRRGHPSLDARVDVGDTPDGPANESPDKAPGKAPDKAPGKSPGHSPDKAPGPVRRPPGGPEPSTPRRPVPTPGEVFPPKRPASAPTPAPPADDRLPALLPARSA